MKANEYSVDRYDVENQKNTGNGLKFWSEGKPNSF